MKLLINASVLGTKPTGLGVYAENCISGISKKIQCSLIACEGFSDLEVELKSPPKVVIGAGRLAPMWRLLWSKRVRIRPERLVYSPTHHGLGDYSNQIITVHDLICLKYPRQHLFQYLFFKFWLPSRLRKCRAVFTVSETSKQDIVATYGYPANKVFVVPNGVDSSSEKVSPRVKLTDPYLLMVGARYPHKNVDEVIRNSSAWAATYKLFVLSCSGRYRKSLMKLIDKQGIVDRVVFLDYVPREKLIDLYQGCAALIYPSKWEGFGIPPLEALSYGSPVIVSSIPVHREILGNSAIYFELGQEESWAAAFNELSNEDLVKAKLLEARRVLKKYSPENSIEALTRSLLTVEPNLELLE